MKASEVTESGFYWWKRPESHGNGFDGFPGWQPVRIQILPEAMNVWIMGSEFYWEGEDLDGELIGPMHDPEQVKRKWSIWSEGYAVTGNEAPAQWMGDIEAATFPEACAIWAEKCSDRGSFNRDKLTYWGCRLFDNEADARRSFG